MDSTTMVDVRLAAGQQLLDKLHDIQFGVLLAFWAKREDDPEWYLYLVSPHVDLEGRPSTYAIVQGAIRGMPQPFDLGPFDLRVLSPSEPLAKGLLALQQQQPTARVLRCGERSFGLTHIEGALIYPPRKTAKA